VKTRLSLGLGLMLCGVASTASAQSILFDFDNGPQYSGTPLDQISGGVRAHFDATGSAYSIQNIAQVIGMYPTGFAGLGLSPGSVFQSDLTISFFDSATSAPQYLSSIFAHGRASRVGLRHLFDDEDHRVRRRQPSWISDRPSFGRCLYLADNRPRVFIGPAI